MKLPWFDNRCILCLKSSDLSEEHIIPEAIGGRLTIKFLCPDCNSLLGRDVEKAVKDDPSIRIALENLSRDIPDLYSQITEKQPFYGHSKAGRVPGFFRKGEFYVKSKKMADGSLVQPTKTAKKSIKTMLKRQGCTVTQIEEVLSNFEDAPSNKISEIHPGLEASKWDIEKTEIDFTGTSLMNPLVPLKIAYEFIAYLRGTSICASKPQLEEIRNALSIHDTDNDCFQVDRLNAKEYKPFHGIVFEGNKPHAQVQIRLFGWLAFRVHFKRLSVHEPRYVYTHFLDKNLEDFRIVEDNIKNSPTKACIRS